jgi:ABC-type multidrug transport system permease subunit
MVMSVAMALAFPSKGIQPVRVGVAPGATELRQTLAADKGIALRDITPGNDLRALREGEVDIVVMPGSPPTYRFDPTREESRSARLMVDNALKRGAGRPDPWTAHEDAVQIAGSRYVDWLIPGIVCLGIMNNGMWSIGFMTVQARLRKLLKRLAASPMKKSEYLLAQMLARLVFLAPEVAVPLLFGVIAFNMPVNGTVVNIAGVALAGALMFGAVGLLLGSRVKTIEAISGLMNLFSVPMWVLSGVFFSSSNFPPVTQPFIKVLPLTALVDAMRAVVLEGSTLGAIGTELVIMMSWAVVAFAIALKIFRWR